MGFSWGTGHFIRRPGGGLNHVRHRRMMVPALRGHAARRFAMARSSSPGQGLTARAAFVGAVKSTLGFFVALLVIAEATLGAAGLSARDANTQQLALVAMLAVLVGVSALVAVLALKRPDVLMRTIGSEAAAEAQRQQFMDQLYGEWAERVAGPGVTALSIVEISSDPVAHSLRLTGRGYDAAGGEASFWNTTAIGIDAGARKLLYYWEGNELRDPGPKLEGYGEITFYAVGPVLEGSGRFSDANLGNPRPKILRKGVLMQKLTPEEAKKWHEARDAAARASWVASKLETMTPARAVAEPALG
jgi:hypothetical protein